jgi:hypothetical protein
MGGTREGGSVDGANLSDTLQADTAMEPIVIPDIDTGSMVEVRRRFDRAWARGFRVVDTDETGYSIRRESDGVVLPVRFPAADLRLARNIDDEPLRVRP